MARSRNEEDQSVHVGFSGTVRVEEICRPTHRGDPEFLWSEPPRDEHVHDER